jgi:hypothetical protein
MIRAEIELDLIIKHILAAPPELEASLPLTPT